VERVAVRLFGRSHKDIGSGFQDTDLNGFQDWISKGGFGFQLDLDFICLLVQRCNAGSPEKIDHSRIMV
jgi:hypothetical protein